MKKRKLKRVLYTSASAMALAATVVTCIPAEAYLAAGTYTVQNGVLNFSRGNGSITIQGNSNQSLSGKQFRIYKKAIEP